MKKLIAILFIGIIGTSVSAHEGMWIPSLLKALEDDMQSKGLKLSADDIYSINHSSLKDAIVHFGGGCTAEVVSKNGLILTNHHCGYGQIQQHSSLENDYLKNGFWAMSSAEELKNPGLTATFIVRIEDVTKQINEEAAKNSDPAASYQLMKALSDKLTKEAVEGTNHKAAIKPFNYGNEYYMIVTETFDDVRLVGAPPSAIGKFGGDTDNWVWPRHTGDFSVFRIYSNKENKPAAISDENIPYSPKSWLPVSMEGLEEDDFTMVFGFPGRTQQYLSSYAVKDYIETINPARIAMRKESLKIIDAAMASSDKTRIQYASKQSRISNAYKKWIGQNLGLKKKGAIAKKEALEAEYLKRVPRDGKYKNVLQDLKINQKAISAHELGYNLYWEIWYYGPEIIRFSHGFKDLLSEDFAGKVEKKRKNIQNYFKNYNVDVDKKVFAKLLKMYYNFLLDDQKPELLKEINKKYNGNFELYADHVYKKSFFSSQSRVERLLNLNEKKMLNALKRDPVYVLATKIKENNDSKIVSKYREYAIEINGLMKRFVQAQQEYFPEKTFWADANSTLRLTYGKVESTQPRDGMKYTWYTTLDGIIEKNNTGESDFAIPDRLRTLWEKKDYGQYATNGDLRICFLGSNHTTGGNSGSPVINGEGHLVGINFDRSWESTMSDIMFDGDICRNIMVDIKYVLWVMDKYAGAGHLVDEMTLVDEDWRKEQIVKANKKKIEQYSNRLRAVPSDIYALTGRAEIYQELGRELEAMADLNEALKIAPKNTSALNQRATYNLDAGKIGDAMDDISLSLKINNSDNSEAYFVRGLLYSGQKKYEDAIKDYDKVIDMDYTAYKAYYNRGVCYRALGDVDEACSNFEISKLMGSENAEKMYHLNCEFGAW